MWKVVNMNPTYRDECIRHYVERGYSEEHAARIVPSDEGKILALYETIRSDEARSKQTAREQMHLAGLTIQHIIPGSAERTDNNFGQSRLTVL